VLANLHKKTFSALIARSRISLFFSGSSNRRNSGRSQDFKKYSIAPGDCRMFSGALFFFQALGFYYNAMSLTQPCPRHPSDHLMAFQHVSYHVMLEVVTIGNVPLDAYFKKVNASDLTTLKAPYSIQAQPTHIYSAI
jgi:hypothetical protein